MSFCAETVDEAADPDTLAELGAESWRAEGSSSIITTFERSGKSDFSSETDRGGCGVGNVLLGVCAAGSEFIGSLQTVCGVRREDVAMGDDVAIGNGVGG